MASAAYSNIQLSPINGQFILTARYMGMPVSREFSKRHQAVTFAVKHWGASSNIVGEKE